MSALVSGVARVESGIDLATAAWLKRPPRLSRMDRPCGLAMYLLERLLLDAGISPGGPDWIPERVGVTVGTSLGCHQVNEEYFRGMIEGGAAGASPRLFSYTLPSSPLGEVSIAACARGPAQTFVSGAHAGLEAFDAARRLCEEGLAALGK